MVYMSPSIKNTCLKASALVLVLFFTQCAKEKTKDKMSFDELSDKTKTALKAKKRDNAITYLEEIVSRYPDHANIAKYKILLAEMYFKDGRYAAAQEVYEHFNQFYPADKRTEYAKYKSIMAMFYQTLKTDCDQTETEETVKLCQEYIQNNAFKQYRKEVQDIQTTCQNKLIDKEIYIFSFYLKQGHLDAAQGRLKYLKDKYLALNPALDARLLYLECKLAKKQKNLTLVHENVKTLRTKYASSSFTQMAQALTEKQRPFIF